MAEATYRHDPTKFTVQLQGDSANYRWDTEPAVHAFRRLEYEKADGRRIPVPICGTPVVVQGVGIIVGGYDGYVTFFDVSLERIYWRRRLDSPIYASLIVDARRKRVIAVSTRGSIACFDLQGNQVWRISLNAPVYATPAMSVKADAIMVVGFGGVCAAVESSTGEVIFRTSLPLPWHRGAASRRDPYASPAVTTDGDFIVGCAEHVLRIAPTGDQLWCTDVAHSVRSSPAVLDRDYAAVVPVDGCVRFLALQDGSVVNELTLGSKCVGSPAVSKERLVIGLENDEAVGIDIRSQTVAWRRQGVTPRDHTSFTVSPNGDFIVTAKNGNVVCLAPRDGTYRWETSQLLGLSSHSPAIDTTPIVVTAGDMYAGSYTGMLYQFRFRCI